MYYAILANKPKRQRWWAVQHSGSVLRRNYTEEWLRNSGWIKQRSPSARYIITTLRGRCATDWSLLTDHFLYIPGHQASRLIGSLIDQRFNGRPSPYLSAIYLCILGKHLHFATLQHITFNVRLSSKRVYLKLLKNVRSKPSVWARIPPGALKRTEVSNCHYSWARKA